MLLGLCYITHSVALTGEVILLGVASTTRGLNACGVTYLLAAPMYFTTCFIIWKKLGSWNQIMKHLAALHFIFLPRINRHLHTFESGHNSGPISTEQNNSPEQLWIRGMLAVRNADFSVAQEFREEVNQDL